MKILSSTLMASTVFFSKLADLSALHHNLITFMILFTYSVFIKLPSAIVSHFCLSNDRLLKSERLNSYFHGWGVVLGLRSTGSGETGFPVSEESDVFNCDTERQHRKAGLPRVQAPLEQHQEMAGVCSSLKQRSVLGSFDCELLHLNVSERPCCHFRQYSTAAVDYRRSRTRIKHHLF